jgi:hypothetical protein
LQGGRNVGRQNEIGLAIRFRQHRFEILKDIERNRARLRRVQVHEYSPTSESFPFTRCTPSLSILPTSKTGIQIRESRRHDADKPD